MQPRGERGFAAKRADFPKQLKESFLSQILSFRGVSNHPQAQRVNPAIVELIDSLERCRVTLLRPPDGFRLRQFRILDSPRSGHDTLRGSSRVASRRLLLQLYSQYPRLIARNRWAKAYVRIVEN